MRRTIALVVALVGTAVAEPKPAGGITHVSINYTYASFHRNALSYSISWKDGAYRVGTRAIDSARVEALLAALTDLKPSDRELRCISHTDDYPEFHVTLGKDAWAPTIDLASSSNCHANVPWNVTRDGKRYVQFSGAAGRAVRSLLVAIDPKNWKAGPDRPEASTSGPEPYEPVWLDEYLEGGQSTTRAGTCARDLETSARAKQLFGAAPRVKKLALSCNLIKSADCTAITALTELTWSGLDATVELPCTGGKVAFPAELEQLRDVVASKPVRALVKLAGASHVRMWPAWGEWLLEAGAQNLPRLTYTPGTFVIHARSTAKRGPSAVAFWTALGLDARTLTRKDGGWSETTAKLDFKGKLLK